MSALAVVTFVANQASSVSLTSLIWARLIGYAVPPKYAKAGAQALLVVGTPEEEENRLTPPRGTGEKEVIWQVPVLVYATHTKVTEGGQHFYALLQRIRAQYSQLSPGNPTITDPITNDTSYITYIGERQRMRILDLFATVFRGRTAFRAILTLEVREILTPQ